jgi:hypothetical protein
MWRTACCFVPEDKLFDLSLHYVLKSQSKWTLLRWGKNVRNYTPMMMSKCTLLWSSQLDTKNCFKFPSLTSGHLVKRIWIDTHCTVFTRQHSECISAHYTDTGLNSRDAGTLVTWQRTMDKYAGRIWNATSLWKGRRCQISLLCNRRRGSSCCLFHHFKLKEVLDRFYCTYWNTRHYVSAIGSVRLFRYCFFQNNSHCMLTIYTAIKPGLRSPCGDSLLGRSKSEDVVRSCSRNVAYYISVQRMGKLQKACECKCIHHRQNAIE